VLSREHPFHAEEFALPPTTGLDARLIGGASLFGAGWGLTGFCPGPAIASLVFGMWPTVLFVLAMAAGMLAVHLLTGRSPQAAPGAADG
jgi:hypothetical protein